MNTIETYETTIKNNDFKSKVQRLLKSNIRSHYIFTYLRACILRASWCKSPDIVNKMMVALSSLESEIFVKLNQI